jgi:hypothetical protein
VPDDRSSIEGLADKHVRAPNRRHLTGLRELAQADPEVIYRAMASLRPRPSHEQVAHWQDDASNQMDEMAPDPAAWQTAASFVVVFSQRRKDQIWERRVEAERTEVEPERAMQVWSGWNAAPVCAWIAGQLGQAIGEGGPPAPAPRPAAARPQLRIDTAVLIDAVGRTDVVAGGVSAARPRTELVAPVRVIFTISGAPPQARLRAVTRIQRRDGAGWNPQTPVILSGPGQAEFDLARVPAGDHELALIAWAPDATARPVSVRLPRVTIRPEPG